MSDTSTQESTQQWHAVMNVDDLWEGELESVEVGDTSVLLINLGEQVVAYKNRCPHQAWPLHDGDLEDTTLTCAQHLWEFDVSTGKGVNPSTCALISYPCKVDDDGTVQVCL